MSKLDISWNNQSISRVNSSKLFSDHSRLLDGVSISSNKPFQRKTDLKSNLLQRRRKNEKTNRNQFKYISPKHNTNDNNDEGSICLDTSLNQSFLKAETDKLIQAPRQLLKQLNSPKTMLKKSTTSTACLKSIAFDKTRCDEIQKNLQIKLLELEKTNKNLKEENYKLKLKINKVEISHNLTLNEIKHKNSQIENLRASLEQQRKKTTESKKIIASLQADLKTLNIKIKKIACQNERLQGHHLKQALTVKQQELFKVKLQMYEFQKIAQYKSLEVDTIRKKFHDASQQSTNLNKQLSSFKKQNQDMKIKINKLQNFKHKFVNSQHDRKNRFCNQEARDHQVSLQLTPEK